MKRFLTSLILITLWMTRASAFEAVSGKAIDIWEGTSCNASVKLTPYLAGSSDAPACIVCPGGSYFWLDRDTEGKDVAQWLQSNGISAFVLEYRVAGIPAFITHYRILSRGNRYPDMLQDVQRSIQLIRENASLLGIDPAKIGVMGFSAGGHLAGMAGLFFDSNILNACGVYPSVSLRPDFIAPIYPVVSLVDRSTHKRSRRGLLGEGGSISPLMKDSLSLERHVRPDMPPVYLMNCTDDPVVKYRNSVMLDSALTAAGVNHRYRQFGSGGHGFGASPHKTTEEAITWKEDFLDWIKNLFR